ncbi:MAG: molybdate ABC transporter substrate-binding protein [Actinomycetota bacterium]|nr:molybdate ABC transporter substrate-binding protein [Actinomycetota bacterium]
MASFVRYRFTIGLILVLALMAGCADSEGGREQVRVSAASSLTVPFAEIESLFEEMHPDYDLVLNLGASSLLREQILAGAPADAFASANESIMDEVAADGLVVGEVLVFTLNTLEIAVPRGNPGAVTGLEDFARDDLLLGICAAGVPCGDLARASLGLAGVTLAPHSDESNARSLLTKTAAGELDAGIVYVSDVQGNADVEGVAIPAGLNQETRYPVAALSGGSSPEGAAAFIEFLLSEEGQAILLSHGFQRP